MQRVNILKTTTKGVMDSNLIPKESKFSLAFIDGLHTAEGVKIDFDFSYSHLEHRGVIVFDDYFEPSVPDYSQMIEHLIVEKSLNLVQNKDAKLVYCIKP